MVYNKTNILGCVLRIELGEKFFGEDKVKFIQYQLKDPLLNEVDNMSGKV